MRAHLGVDSLRFVSLDGLYRACGRGGRARRRAAAVLRRLFLRRLSGAAVRHDRARLRDPRAGVIAGSRDRRPGHRGEPRLRLRRRASRSGAAGAQVIGDGAHRRRARGSRRRDRGGGRADADAGAAVDHRRRRDAAALPRDPRALGPARPGGPRRRPRRAADARPSQIAAKDFDASVEVNLRGTQRLIAMTAPLLAAAPAGVFVQVADDRAGRAVLRQLRRDQGRRPTRWRGPGRRRPRGSGRGWCCSGPRRCRRRCARGSIRARRRRG